jgi:transcriptional regulator with XRE-family HTH domain
MARRGRPSRELTPYASVWHRLGAELRSRREHLGLSQAQLGRLIRCSGALVGKIELGGRRASLDTIERADTALRAGGVLTALWHSATEHDSATASATAPSTARDLADPGRVGELAEASLRWASELPAAVDVTRAMWRAEATDRCALASTVWDPSAYTSPLHTTTDATAAAIAEGPAVLGHSSGRMVGQADVEGLWQMSAAFTDFDHRLGGGYARSTLIHFLDAVVRPTLDGRYTDQVGRGLLAAAARLCDLAAFMSFDSGEQGLAQRYFLQALRLAHASGHHALTGHILGDMSMQAHQLGEPRGRWISPTPASPTPAAADPPPPPPGAQCCKAAPTPCEVTPRTRPAPGYAPNKPSTTPTTSPVGSGSSPRPNSPSKPSTSPPNSANATKSNASPTRSTSALPARAPTTCNAAASSAPPPSPAPTSPPHTTSPPPAVVRTRSTSTTPPGSSPRSCPP